MFSFTWKNKCLEEPAEYEKEVNCWGRKGGLLYEVSELTADSWDRDQYGFDGETDSWRVDSA